MTPISRPLLALAVFAAVPAVAQESAVYIGQVDRSAAPRDRTTRPGAADQILLQGASAAGPENSAAPAGAAPGFPSALSPSIAAGVQGGNLAVLNQFGSGNTATILQSGSGNVAETTAEGNGNVTSQIQSGRGNSSSLTVSGDNNRSILINQDGKNNVANWSFTGNNNSLNSNQIGNNLSIGLDVIGSGKNITVNQTNTGSTSTGLPLGHSGAMSSARTR